MRQRNEARSITDVNMSFCNAAFNKGWLWYIATINFLPGGNSNVV
jgi:hypothetical protein